MGQCFRRHLCRLRPSPAYSVRINAKLQTPDLCQVSPSEYQSSRALLGVVFVLALVFVYGPYTVASAGPPQKSDSGSHDESSGSVTIPEIDRPVDFC